MRATLKLTAGYTQSHMPGPSNLTARLHVLQLFRRKVHDGAL